MDGWGHPDRNLEPARLSFAEGAERDSARVFEDTMNGER
jgi:hypothetical protein